MLGKRTCSRHHASWVGRRISSNSKRHRAYPESTGVEGLPGDRAQLSRYWHWPAPWWRRWRLPRCPKGAHHPLPPGCQFLMRSTKKRFASARLYPVGSPPPVELANRGSWCGRRRTGARGCRAGRENRGFWRPFPARIPWSGGIGGDLAGFGNLVRRADRVAIRAGIRARGRFAREIFWKLFDQRILSAVKSQEKTRKHAHFCELEKFHVRIGAARSIKRYGTGQTRT